MKGFALMLLIGTLISLLTAVAATRAMLGLLAGFRWFDNPRFMGAHGQQTAKWLQIDFMRRRYLWFAISGVVIVVGVGSLGVRGLNLGIDFKGGTQITFKTHTAQTTTEGAPDRGRRRAAGRGRPGPRHVAANGDSTRRWQMRTKSLTPRAAERRSTSDLTQQGRRVRERARRTSRRASATRSPIDAIWGIIVSMLLIIVYITLRFDIKFAVPVIVAMLHDIADHGRRLLARRSRR